MHSRLPSSGPTPAPLAWFGVEIVHFQVEFPSISQFTGIICVRKKAIKTTNHLPRAFLSKEPWLCTLLTICLSFKAYNFMHITPKGYLSALPTQLFSPVLCFFLSEIQSTYYLFEQPSLTVDFLRQWGEESHNSRELLEMIKPILCYSTYRLSAIHISHLKSYLCDFLWKDMQNQYYWKINIYK